MENERKLPTPNQHRLIELLIENYGKKATGRRSFKSILLEAGYSPATAKQPSIIIGAPIVQKAIQDHAELMRGKREKFIHSLTDKKIAKATIGDAVYAIDALTRNERLLSGKSTSNIAGYIVNDEDRKALDELLERNKKRVANG